MFVDIKNIVPKTFFLIAGCLFILMVQGNIAWGQGTIEGTVVSGATGEPLPGANVLVRGTDLGAATGSDGTYQIAGVEPGTYTVRATYIGYSKEVEKGIMVRDGETAKVDFILQQVAEGLNELVVVGYGDQKRGRLTSSVSTISAEDLEEYPEQSISKALQGRISGMRVTRRSGAAGTGAQIVIRGRNSLRGGSQALVVVDGQAGVRTSGLDPDNIESITVLKDAAATAIYGSRGSNGVIVIETKDARKGKQKVEFSSALEVSATPMKMDLLGPVGYARMLGDRERTLGDGRIYSEEEIAEIRRQGGTDWQDRIFRRGLTQRYSLSMRRGNETVGYYMSGHYIDEEGIMIEDDFSRYGLRANLSAGGNTLNTQLKLRASQRISDRGGFPLQRALKWSPHLPARTESGELHPSPQGYGPFRPNPLFVAKGKDNRRTITDLSGNLTFDASLHETLTLKVNGSVRHTDQSAKLFQEHWPRRRALPAEHAEGISINQLNIQHDESLTFENTFNENHHLKATALFEQQWETTTLGRFMTRGLTTGALGYYGIGLGEAEPNGAKKEKWQIMSYAGRANYTLMDRYIFGASLRADGSSRFAEGNRWGLFPTGSVAWRLSEESFMESAAWLNNLKLRASWGLTGSQTIGAYTTLAKLEPDQFVSWDGETRTVGIGPGEQAPNPGLTWEKTEQINVGFDASLFQDRLSLTANVYQKNTRDLLLEKSVPQFLGYSTKFVNLGEVRNRGVELELDMTPAKERGKYTWNLGVNFSANRNKVLELGFPNREGEKILGTNFLRNGGITATSIVKEGQPLGLFYGLIYEGVWKESEAEEAARFGQKPGDARYRDLNDNGFYDDLTIIGNANPDFRVGVNTAFHYGNFSLRALLYSVQGQQRYNFTRWITFEAMTNPAWKDRWTPENSDTNIPAFSKTARFYGQSDLFVEDASYIRLRSVSLTYRLPKSLMNGLPVTDGHLSLGGQNLLTITGYSGFDPEANSSASSINQGIDHVAYPNPRTFTFSVDLTF